MSAPPLSPGCSSDARISTSRSGLRPVVDVGAGGRDLLADLEGGRTELPASRVPEHGPDPALLDGAANERGPAQVVGSEHGEVAVGIERDHLRPHLGPVAALDDGLVLSCDHVRVGDHQPGADDEPAPLLDGGARDALHLHRRGDDGVDHRLRDVGGGRRGPEVRRPLEHVREHAAELLVADQAPQAVDGVGRVGQAVLDPGGERGAARLGGEPSGHIGHQGKEDPDGHDHAGQPSAGTGRAVDRPHARPGQGRVQPGADEQAEGLTDERGAREDPHRHEEQLLAARQVEQAQDRRQHERAHHQTDGQAHPRRHTRQEPEAIAPDDRRAGTDDDEQVERVQEGWPRSRACVRKPVCATIRWSGRTDWPSMCQPRWSTSIVSAIPKSDSARVSRSWAAWVIWGV